MGDSDSKSGISFFSSRVINHSYNERDRETIPKLKRGGNVMTTLKEIMNIYTEETGEQASEIGYIWEAEES